MGDFMAVPPENEEQYGVGGPHLRCISHYSTS